MIAERRKVPYVNFVKSKIKSIRKGSDEDLIRVAIGYALAKLRHDSGQSNSIDIGEIRAKIRGVEDKLNSFTQIKSKCTSISNDTTKIENIADEIKQDIATSIQEIAALVNNNSESGTENEN